MQTFKHPAGGHIIVPSTVAAFRLMIAKKFIRFNHVVLEVATPVAAWVWWVGAAKGVA